MTKTLTKALPAGVTYLREEIEDMVIKYNTDGKIYGRYAGAPPFEMERTDERVVRALVTDNRVTAADFK